MPVCVVTRICLAAALAGTAALGQAADVWPTRPITIVVPSAAGGGGDIVARGLAYQLSEGLRQTVIVENRVGAGGLIGTKYVANAAPDGYTFLMGTQSTLAVGPLLGKNLEFLPGKAFSGVSLVASSPLLLVAHPTFPAKSVPELVALAKKQPGGINYGSGGFGTTPHMAGELLALTTGIKMTHVAYKGEQPAMTDLMGNQIPLAFANLPTAWPLVKGGKLQVLAITSAIRSPTAPDVPTVAESGVPGFEAATWFGVVAPRSTPKEIIDKLSAEISKALESPQVRQSMEAQGLILYKSTPSQFDKHIAVEYEKWARVIKEANITGTP